MAILRGTKHYLIKGLARCPLGHITMIIKITAQLDFTILFYHSSFFIILDGGYGYRAPETFDNQTYAI